MLNLKSTIIAMTLPLIASNRDSKTMYYCLFFWFWEAHIMGYKIKLLLHLHSFLTEKITQKNIRVTENPRKKKMLMTTMTRTKKITIIIIVLKVFAIFFFFVFSSFTWFKAHIFLLMWHMF